MAALSEIEKLEARWAENPDGRYFAPLADAYRKAGRVDDAIQVVSQGLVKHPDYLSAHIVLGRCFLEKKDDVQASGAFEKVLSLDSENIIALKSLAEISEREGKTDDARKWLQRLLTIDAMNTEASEDLARLGGPLAEEAAPAPAEEAGVSFADFVSSPPEEPAPAPPPAPEPEPVVPKTIERVAVNAAELARMQNEKTAEMEPVNIEPPAAVSSEDATAPMPALEIESTSFQPPEEGTTAAAAPDLMPFDDQLQWGAGERQSRAIHQEDLGAVAHSSDTADAIDFMGAAEKARRESVPSLEAQPEPAAADWSGAPEVPTLNLETAHAGAADSGLGTGTEEPTIELGSSVEPHRASGDLPLIMPEDVTPAEELRRPSSKQVQMVSPEPEPESMAPAQPLATETMGDLYMKQGLREQAAEVYRQLLAARPGDAGLTAKLASATGQQGMSASASGHEALGSWLRRIARASLRTPAAAPPPAPAAGPSPMEQAFAAAEPEPEPVPAPAPEPAPTPSGQPARPATDQFSLDQIFGGGGGGSTPATTSGATSHALGASFDEFFGGAPKPEPAAPPAEGAPAARPSEDDLSAFTTWLHGLKR